MSLAVPFRASLLFCLNGIYPSYFSKASAYRITGWFCSQSWIAKSFFRCLIQIVNSLLVPAAGFRHCDIRSIRTMAYFVWILRAILRRCVMLACQCSCRASAWIRLRSLQIYPALKLLMSFFVFNVTSSTPNQTVSIPIWALPSC
jgi:hypothetical protein